MDIELQCEVLSVAAMCMWGTYISSTAAKDSPSTGLLLGEWSRPSASWTIGREINGTKTCGPARTGWVLP